MLVNSSQHFLSFIYLLAVESRAEDPRIRSATFTHNLPELSGHWQIAVSPGWEQGELIADFTAVGTAMCRLVRFSQLHWMIQA